MCALYPSRIALRVLWGVGVHDGDRPVLDGFPGDLPPPVRAVRVLGRFHVLPATSASSAYASAAFGSPASEGSAGFFSNCCGSTAASSASASLTRAETSSSLACVSSQAMSGFPARE